jgi:hypothetical protein
MKALLIVDTHWLWYAAGRYGDANRVRRPRVDYMSLRNCVARFLVKRFGEVYDLECAAFVMNRRAGSMERFTDLLEGFGYRVHECNDPTPAVMNMLKTDRWDLIVLAVGSVEVMMSARLIRDDGRRVVLASFTPVENGVDATLSLDGSVLYEGA